MLQFAGKNRAGRKQELQQRAVDLVKLNSKEVQVKIKELSTLMYRQMGTASSVNPYSRNYDNAGKRNAGAAAAGSNEDSSNGGAESTNSEEGESESPSSPEPKSRKEADIKEREKVRQQAILKQVGSLSLLINHENPVQVPYVIIDREGAGKGAREDLEQYAEHGIDEWQAAPECRCGRLCQHHSQHQGL